ncbi:hypothetical protein QRD02_12775 [Aequorivita sp. SDUM287046]|uniref:DUF748 domain-containing protein n=1 Tax=Aequorivita aurantiaca TaxID=3053356 RepID=A0ABT8DMQ1_9FLAO|nr:hypothetical protein [Aequorivita aurantiaca]MDN3725256.1 hypothetical protein [Aequorivita aurantiaca]
MNKRIRKIFFIVLAVGAIFIIANVVINDILKSKLELFIKERLPDNMTRTYDDLTVESFDGSLILSNASLIIKNKIDGVEHTFITVERLKISDISYWDYLINDKIHVDAISLYNPKIVYYQDRLKPSKDSVRQAVARIYKPIIVDRVFIENTKLAIYEKGEDSLKVYSAGLTLKVDGIKVDNKSIVQKIPFEYKDFEAKSDTVFVKVSPYENLTVENFSIEDKDAVFTNVLLKTKYSRRELSKVILQERDHFDLSLKTLKIQDFDFGFLQNKFFAKSKHIALNSPSLEIYRDKLVADDPKIKPLYSKMLRDLPFDLTLDSLTIDNANVIYEERVKEENMGGSINFKNLTAAVSNVSNTYSGSERTSIKVKADFMENTPFSVDWQFDVQNPEDQFLFRTEVGPLAAAKMNSFTEPNLKVKLQGNTNKTYFTIDGNNETSTTDMKISYSDFKITVLQKDGKKKNEFLSVLTDIFVPKDSKKVGENFKEGTAEATRDKTKSVFNFLWISVKSALLKIMI